MKCKVCGVELKKDGDICNNCMNKIMKEQEIRSDRKGLYTMKSSFSLGYELLKHIEEFGVAIFTFILFMSVQRSWLKYLLVAMVVFVIYEILHMLYIKRYKNRLTVTFYKTKLVYTKGAFFRKSIEIPYSEVSDISYQEGALNKMFNNGNIIIKREGFRHLEKFIMIDSVKNIDEVIGKIKEVYR